MTPEEKEKLAAAVAEHGAFPMPAGSEPKPVDNGRLSLPDGGHWTDVPELVDRTVAGIQARLDGALSGHWYDASVTERWRAPGTVCTRVDGAHRTVGQITGMLLGDKELILHAHDDLSWCLGMIAKLRAQVSELESERHSTNEALDDAVQALRANQQGPALPWAATMPDDDLHGFLDSLVSAALDRWRSDPVVPDREVLAAVERACAQWRTPGQGFRSDEDEAVEAGTLPAWLHWRFGPHGQRWQTLADDDRSYWEHHAQAVRRAVARGGFKSGGGDMALALGKDAPVEASHPAPCRWPSSPDCTCTSGGV